MSRTKFIATIGPASFSQSVMKKMVKHGLSCVRINTAHVEPDYIGKVRKLVDAVNLIQGSHVSIMVDLKGPELRLSDFKNGNFSVRRGKEYTLSGTGGNGDMKLNNDRVLESLETGTVLKMNDGKVSFKVTDRKGDVLILKALDTGGMRSHARVNIPGVELDLGNVTERDMEFIRASVKEEVEHYAMSFVQNRKDVTELERILRSEGSNSGVVSKVETMAGYKNIREISLASEMVMVARGDLGVELPLSEIGIAQKKIIMECHRHGIPTILATQILESMVSSPEPTRAEILDITNAVFDSADILMLSEESAIGKYPAESVMFLRSASEFAENSLKNEIEPEDFQGNKVAYTIARAAKMTVTMTNADGIIAFTKNGNTARMLSALRPEKDIFAVVTSHRLARRLNLYYAVRPIIIPESFATTTDLAHLIKYLSENRNFSRGKRFVTLSGLPYFLYGGTNDMRLVTMGEFIGRGYPAGKSMSGTVSTQLEDRSDILIVNGSSYSDDYRIYKGIIFTGFPIQQDMEKMREKNISFLSGAQFYRTIKNGEKIFWDSATGIIISS